MREVERIVYQRITEGLYGGSDMQLKCSTLYAICGYRIPEKTAGTKDIRLLVECHSPRMNEYRAQTALYIKGVDFGVIDERMLYGVDVTFLGFAERADIIVETILEDNFPALLEQVVRAKYESKNSTNIT